VAPLSFEQARACVLAKLESAPKPAATEEVPLLEAAGRVLAERVTADRDYPPVSRSMRDGFAVRAADLPGTFKIIGEVRAGVQFSGKVDAGETVEIMTGAPVPTGADSVVMVEHTTVNGGTVSIERKLSPGENVNPKGVEASQGATVLGAGMRLGYAEVAMLATVGRARIPVFRRPRVAILTTGDEILEIAATPRDYQIRNSNGYSISAQVARAGGCPCLLDVARDEYQSTRHLIERGLEHDLLLLSGGVSAGKYDIVERVLADLGAEFFFDRVLIQPGQPLVFGSAHGKFFFGLPGNPLSTMVTFEVFARAAVERLGGQTSTMLPITWTRLATDFRQKPGLTRFLPAQLSPDGAELTPVKWHGSGDVASLTRANAFLVTEPSRERWAAGDWIRVLPK
jgi:molybdopterin molybdotransferase